ncbi:hypothetical protein [Terrilactibacillus laevilacticus]|uniref:Uncharacterized protein n=2 Tax=Terrilactibacillus laevilacticus TaxID=1380157 RepID=A0ABW5PMD3_9BACI|nr:hypothetical protein [Terrilactibacillus laevilacticus]
MGFIVVGGVMLNFFIKDDFKNDDDEQIKGWKRLLLMAYTIYDILSWGSYIYLPLGLILLGILLLFFP